MARAINILVELSQIPRWKKKIGATFSFWAPKDASQGMLDEMAQRVIAARKAMQECDKNGGSEK